MFNNKSITDMQFTNLLKSKLPFFVATSALLVLASCGSYQYSGYDNDGIYNSKKQINEEVPVETTTAANENTYYKNYFSDKSRQYDEIVQQSEIFTDIDSYEDSAQVESDSTEIVEYNARYGGWGSDHNEATVIYIDNGFNNWGYNPWGWNAGWGWGWNVGWGWNAGWGWGWNAGWGFYDPFWGPGYGWGWGYGWNSYWCPPYYNNGYYRGRGLAYNYGRRGSLYNSSLARRTNNSLAQNSIRRNSSLTRSGTRYSTRPRSTVRGRSSSFSSTARPRSTTARPRSTTSKPRSNSFSTRSNSRPSVRSSSSRPSRSFSRGSSSSRSSGRSFSSRGGGRRR